MNVELFKEFVFLYIPHSRDSLREFTTQSSKQENHVIRSTAGAYLHIYINPHRCVLSSVSSIPETAIETAASVITTGRLLVSRQEHTGKYLMTHVIIEYKQRVRSTTLQILPLTYLHKF